jgi:hypothetical protein
MAQPGPTPPLDLPPLVAAVEAALGTTVETLRYLPSIKLVVSTGSEVHFDAMSL